MKKYLALILALAMSCSLLTACGGGEESAPAEDTAEETALVYAVEAGSAGEATAAENGFEYNSVASQADALMEVASGTSDAAIIFGGGAGNIYLVDTVYECAVCRMGANTRFVLLSL